MKPIDTNNNASSNTLHQQAVRGQADRCLSQITDCFVDVKGRHIRLRSDPTKGLVGDVRLPNQRPRFVSGARVRNGLNPVESGDALLARLRAGPIKTWNLAYMEATDSIHVWPTLRAAASEPLPLAGPTNPFSHEVLADLCAKAAAQKQYLDTQRALGRDVKWYQEPVTTQNAPGKFTLAPLDNLHVAPVMNFLVPAGPSAGQICQAEVSRIIRDLFLGIYVSHAVPTSSSNQQKDGTQRIRMPAPYDKTLVGHIMRKANVFAKKAMHHALATDTDNGESPNAVAIETLEAFIAAGALPAVDFTFVPRQRSVKQSGPNVILDGALDVRCDFELHPAFEHQRAIVSDAGNAIAEAMRNALSRSQEAQSALRQLHIVGFMAQLLLTLKERGLMPDLGALPVAFSIDDTDDTETASQPAAKVDQDFDTKWKAHGRAVDFASVPAASMSDALKERLADARPGTACVLEGAGEYFSVEVPIVKFEHAARSPSWLFDLLDRYTQAMPKEDLAKHEWEKKLAGGYALSQDNIAFHEAMTENFAEIRDNFEKASALRERPSEHVAFLTKKRTKSQCTAVQLAHASHDLKLITLTEAWLSEAQRELVRHAQRASQLAAALHENDVATLQTLLMPSASDESQQVDGADKTEDKDWVLTRAMTDTYEKLDRAILGALTQIIPANKTAYFLDYVVAQKKECAAEIVQAVIEQGYILRDHGGGMRPFCRALVNASEAQPDSAAWKMVELMLPYKKEGNSLSLSEGEIAVITANNTQLLRLLHENGHDLDRFEHPEQANIFFTYAEERSLHAVVAELRRLGVKRSNSSCIVM